MRLCPRDSHVKIQGQLEPRGREVSHDLVAECRPTLIPRVSLHCSSFVLPSQECTHICPLEQFFKKKNKKPFTHSLNRFPPASKGVHYTGIQSSEPPHWSVTTDCVPFLYKNKTKDISSLKREHQCYCCSGQERKWNIKSNVVVVLGSWEPWRSQDSLSMAPLQKLHFISCTVTANPELERPLQVIHLHCFSCDVPSVSVSRRLNTLQEPEPQMWQPDRVASSPFHPGR